MDAVSWAYIHGGDAVVSQKYSPICQCGSNGERANTFDPIPTVIVHRHSTPERKYGVPNK